MKYKPSNSFQETWELGVSSALEGKLDIAHQYFCDAVVLCARDKSFSLQRKQRVLTNLLVLKSTKESGSKKKCANTKSLLDSPMLPKRIPLYVEAVSYCKRGDVKTSLANLKIILKECELHEKERLLLNFNIGVLEARKNNFRLAMKYLKEAYKQILTVDLPEGMRIVKYRTIHAFSYLKFHSSKYSSSLKICNELCNELAKIPRPSQELILIKAKNYELIAAIAIVESRWKDAVEALKVCLENLQFLVSKCPANKYYEKKVQDTVRKINQISLLSELPKLAEESTEKITGIAAMPKLDEIQPPKVELLKSMEEEKGIMATPNLDEIQPKKFELLKSENAMPKLVKKTELQPSKVGPLKNELKEALMANISSVKPDLEEIKSTKVAPLAAARELFPVKADSKENIKKLSPKAQSPADDAMKKSPKIEQNEIVEEPMVEKLFTRLNNSSKNIAKMEMKISQLSQLLRMAVSCWALFI
ncbi:hypothetical protein Ciccas_006324 [Cichlidogyrus casuarinus]|uniref:Uncharacterized protein n=1 Tax=Cichlidogyrus casuarinus TaxID=1844966 RepID=A0ABD2Q787_9PLAT